MPTTGLQTFDTTVQATNIWLNDLGEALGVDDQQDAYHALRAVLYTLRDRLPVEEAVHLAAQFPTLIRGIYYEDWRPADKPLKLDRQGFLDLLSQRLNRQYDADAEQIARAVFQVLSKHVTGGEIEDVCGNLPKDLQEMFSGEVASTPRKG